MLRMLKVISALAVLAVVLPGALGAQERRAEAERGWLGIGFVAGNTPGEAQVAQVVPGSAAATAGVRRGDVVLRIDGRPATEETVDGLRDRLHVGDTVRLRIRRDGREIDQAVVAGPRRGGPVVFRDGEVITLRVPTEEVRRRMDSTRVHLERILTRMDSLHGRLEVLRSDSGVVLRMERGGRPLLPGRELRIFGDTTGRPLEIDSIVVLEIDSVARRGGRLEVFPLRDGDPGVPFFLEMGRRGVAGAELVEMNAGLARYFRTDRGLLVVQVSPSTPMARAGVEAGDVIVRAGEAVVEDVADLRRAFVAAGRAGRLPIQVVRDGRQRTLELQWEAGGMLLPRSERVRLEATRAPQPAN